MFSESRVRSNAPPPRSESIGRSTSRASGIIWPAFAPGHDVSTVEDDGRLSQNTFQPLVLHAFLFFLQLLTTITPWKVGSRYLYNLTFSYAELANIFYGNYLVTGPISQCYASILIVTIRYSYLWKKLIHNEHTGELKTQTVTEETRLKVHLISQASGIVRSFRLSRPGLDGN